MAGDPQNPAKDESSSLAPSPPVLVYFLNSFDRGGAELGLLTLVEGGLFRGFDLRVVSIARGTGGLDHRLAELEISVSTLCDRSAMRLVDLPQAFFRFKRLIGGARPSIVIASLPQANILARLALRWDSTPLLIAFEHNIHLAKPIYETVYRATSQRIDWLFSDSPITEQAAIEDRYPHLPAHRDIVPLLQLPDEPVERPEKNAGPFHIVSAARFTSVKNLEAIIDAIAILRRAGHDVTCSLFGEGPNRGVYLKRARDAGIEEYVSSPGFVDDWIKRPADAFVVCSQFEGLCIALVQAMNAGIPAIAPLVGGIPSYADERTMECLADVDPNTVANSILNAMKSPDLTKSKAAAARRRVQDLFGREQTNATYRMLNQKLHKMQALRLN